MRVRPQSEEQTHAGLSYTRVLVMSVVFTPRVDFGSELWPPTLSSLPQAGTLGELAVCLLLTMD